MSKGIAIHIFLYIQCFHLPWPLVPTNAPLPMYHHAIGTLNAKLTALPVKGTQIVNGSCEFSCSVTNSLVSLTFPGTVTGIGAVQILVEEAMVTPVMMRCEMSTASVMVYLHLSRAIL